MKGAVQTASLADTKAAVIAIIKARDLTYDIEKMAAASDYVGVAKILNSKVFSDLEPAFSTLVRSDAISSEDKISLGTIKRYGTVADALIMIGGLGSELRAGGFEVGGEVKPMQGAIIDDEATDDEEKKLDPDAVKKYVGLVRDSLNDICRIGEPVLSKK